LACRLKRLAESTSCLSGLSLYFHVSPLKRYVFAGFFKAF